ILYFNSATNISEIRDGTSQTLIVSEVRGFRPRAIDDEATFSGDGGRGMRWEVGTSPMLQPINGIDGEASTNCPGCRWENMSSFHPGGIHVLTADGATRFISQNMDATALLNLGSMRDGKRADFSE
ncbi:MAG: DUF1559 domain-containing protein, partial [Planctomycetia bacterium]